MSKTTMRNATQDRKLLDAELNEVTGGADAAPLGRAAGEYGKNEQKLFIPGPR